MKYETIWEKGDFGDCDCSKEGFISLSIRTSNNGEKRLLVDGTCNEMDNDRLVLTKEQVKEMIEGLGVALSVLKEYTLVKQNGYYPVYFIYSPRGKHILTIDDKDVAYGVLNQLNSGHMAIIKGK